MKVIADDSDIAKKTAGRTKASARVNMVLHPFAVETVPDGLRGIPFPVSTDDSNEGNRNIFPVGVRFFTVNEGLCFSRLYFYEDAFEDSRSVKDQLCRVIYEGGQSWKNVSAY